MRACVFVGACVCVRVGACAFLRACICTGVAYAPMKAMMQAAKEAREEVCISMYDDVT